MGLRIKSIWILAEQCDGRVTRVFNELYTKAREIASQADGCRVCGVLLGRDLDAFAATVAKSGVDTVYCVEHPKLEAYQCDYYVKAIKDLVEKFSPDALWMGASVMGAELAPSVAAALRTGLAAHCVDISVGKDEQIAYMVPAFGGNVIGEILIPETRPQMATVRAGILDAKPCAEDAKAEIVRYTPSLPDEYVSPVELLSFQPTESPAQKLEDADIVLCAGRGLGSEAYWEKLNLLGRKINAAVGYTRCVVDSKWADTECNMIGTSGKSVKPKLYLGFGVSGATHHVCGMSKSGTIISVNKDSNAKIFGISDYKVVAKSERIIDAMLASYAEDKNRTRCD